VVVGIENGERKFAGRHGDLLQKSGVLTWW
jgi:hypothetical protein